MTHPLLRGLLLACLTLSCAGCASTPPVIETRTVTRQVPVYVPIPPDAIEDVAMPAPGGATNEALAEWIIRLKAALIEANRRLRAVRELQPEK